MRNRRQMLSTIILIAGLVGPTEVCRSQPADTSAFPVWAVPGLADAAEFYFSPDGKSLIGNAKQPGDTSYHVYTINIDGTALRRINDVGDDACSYFFPGGKHVIFTTTRDHPELPKGSYSRPSEYPQGAELYIADRDGANPRRLTRNEYYDAEVSISPNGQWVLFTRQIDGELDLWKVRPDGTEEQQITRTKGLQEGGSFFLDDHTIIYRAWERSDQDTKPMPMTVYTIRADGTDRRQITHEPGTNWAPHPAPDGEHFAYVRVLPPRNFELFIGSLKTGESRRITFQDGFDGFPAISPDGRLLTFSSTRGGHAGALHQFLMDISSLHLGPPVEPVSAGVGAKGGK